MLLKAGPLVFSFLLSLLVFTLVTNKSVRFILPSVPLFVVLLVLTGWKLHSKLGPILLIAIVLCGSSVSLVGALNPQIGTTIGIYGQTPLASPYYSYEYGLPDPSDWHLVQAIEVAAAQNPNAWVAILADHWVFNQDTLKYYALRAGFTGLNFLDSRGTQIGTGDDAFDNFDVVFVKTANIGNPIYLENAAQILSRLSNSTDPFYLTWEMVKTYDLPDQSQLQIFIKIIRNQTAG